jgi:hypothetical protein
MAILEKATSRRFYRVLESEAGAYRGEALQRGQILMTVGPELADVRARVDAGRAEPMPDPGELLPWFSNQVREVNAETFSPQRTEPAPPVYLTQDAVLSRFAWTEDDLKHAKTMLGFPGAARCKHEFVDNYGYRYFDHEWDQASIDEWVKRQARTKDVLVGAVVR